VVKSLSDQEFVAATTNSTGPKVRVISGNAIVDERPVTPPETVVSVFDHETIEVVAPQEIYRDLQGNYLTDSGQAEAAVKVQQSAEERFTATGISVNDVPQLGDPTLYRFEILKDTVVVVKWRHDYALTIASDFLSTSGQIDPLTQAPWAGPLVSEAAG